MKRLLPLAVCVFALIAGGLDAAVVTGKVGFITKRGQSPKANETLVWLEPLGKTAKRPAGKFQMVTRLKTVIPHVIAVPEGSTIEFPNDDAISHNLFSLSSGNAFDLGLYRKGAGKSKKFDNAGIVNVYCNVHPNMSAVVHVMPTAYYAFADANGTYSIEAPAGKYRVVAWNEQGGMTESAVDVDAAGRVNGNVALTIDSRSYRVVQHTNKVGKPYAPPSSKDY